MTVLIMFDDSVADRWAPFALTRPCGELMFGCWTLRERLERTTGGSVSGHVSRPWLRHFSERGAPRVVSSADVPAGATSWCSRAVPAFGAELGREPANLWVDDRLAGVRLPDGADPLDTSWFANPAPVTGLRDAAVAGRWLDEVWDLVAAGPDRLSRDLAHLADSGSWTAPTPEGCWKLGDGPLLLGDDVGVEPGVLFDTRDGPIALADHVQVGSGGRLAGPLYAGERSRLYGGAISCFSGGPHTYVRGEIEEVTVLGYSNKAHDGFLGHAYLGRWVNLGALTTNSDLKNNYGSIRVGPPGAEVDTGLIKLGCLVGDHAKTGIGVLLNTGTIVGAGSNLFGTGMPPKWVEPFSWGTEGARYRRDDFVSTATIVAKRRGVSAGAAYQDWLRDVWEETCGE